MMNLARSCRQIVETHTCNCLQMYSLPTRYIHGTMIMLSSEKKTTENTESNDSTSIGDMSEPTNCCMSGCANCVWIEYAEKISAAIEKSDVDVQKLIIDKIQDPNMKAFLLMELRFRNIIKE